LKIILRILTSLFIGAYLFVVLGFVGKQYDGLPCRGVEVIIRDSLDRGLVTKDDVLNMVLLEYPGLAGNFLSSIETTEIEESLDAVPAIFNAEVYANIEGKLIIELSQRMPLARIEDRDHVKYYLDAQGYVIPSNMDYTPHILHVNGEIPGTYRKEKQISPDDEDGAELMGEILKLARYIHEHPLWKSQIVQVYVRENGEFELIPRVGSQIILFGNADELETKFLKLEILYREGFVHTGWNQYEIINLKYNNQVICTKR
jgi:cell division protein FtsQ